MQNSFVAWLAFRAAPVVSKLRQAVCRSAWQAVALCAVGAALAVFIKWLSEP